MQVQTMQPWDKVDNKYPAALSTWK